MCWRIQLAPTKIRAWTYSRACPTWCGATRIYIYSIIVAYARRTTAAGRRQTCRVDVLRLKCTIALSSTTRSVSVSIEPRVQVSDQRLSSRTHLGLDSLISSDLRCIEWIFVTQTPRTALNRRHRTSKSIHDALVLDELWQKRREMKEKHSHTRIDNSTTL